jgi:C4-dicarboxylate-specific signal transduction histidine kinase
VIAFAAKDGFLGAATSILVSDVAMIGILYLRDFESSTATELQLLMISLSVTGLILGAAVSERSRMAAQLDESNARLRDSQNSLMQASRISLASEMAAALAHELNQPLTAIRNYVRSVRRNLEKPKMRQSAIKADIDLAVQQVDVAASLLRATRTFLEKGEIRFEQLNLKELVKTCFELVEPELRHAGIEWQVTMPETLPPVRGNSVQIQQVILNLVKNAKEAINDGQAEARMIEFEASTNTRPGYVEFTVADSGPGLSAGVRDMLFKPLRSSKPEGLGLGLSLCNTIITAHGGEIWLVESIASRTKFAFTLPCRT